MELLIIKETFILVWSVFSLLHTMRLFILVSPGPLLQVYNVTYVTLFMYCYNLEFVSI